jgi:hypothetical protein
MMNEGYFEKRDEQFKDKCQNALSIFQERNRTYNDAIRRTGLLGACVEIVGVSARLEPLVVQDANLEKADMPKIINALIDLHNYTNIAMMMIEDSNLRGEKG